MAFDQHTFLADAHLVSYVREVGVRVSKCVCTTQEHGNLLLVHM